MDKLIKKIQNTDLTKKEKEVAEFFFRNPADICFMTASEIAKKSEVSDSTVIRFSHSLGFESFNNLKVHLRERISEQMRQSIHLSLVTPSERLGSNLNIFTNGSTQQMALEHSIVSIKDVLVKNTTASFEKAADILVHSNRKFIHGYRTSEANAQHMSFLLNLIVPDVRLSSSGDAKAVESLIDLSENDCVVLFSFSRYSKICSLIRDIATEKKAKIITISDRATAPAASGADVFLAADATSISFFNSPMAAMFVVEILCTMVSNKLVQQNELRLDFANRFLSPDQLY